MDIKKAAFINGIGKYSVVVLQLIVTAVLARLLSVEDYGMVAVVTVFSTFFSTISSLGFGTAVIQNKELDKSDLDNIYSCTLYVGVFAMLVFCLCAPLIAYFYENSAYIMVARLLSFALFFNILNMVPAGVMNRDKRFVEIAKRTIIVYTFGAALAIILAFIGFGYYALVLQSVVTAALSFFWNLKTTKLKVILKFRKESVQKIANYSFFQFAFTVVNYFARNLDNLLVGKFLGTADLAYYNRAYTLMVYPVSNLSGVVTPVLHPILSDYQNEKELIYSKYIKLVKLLLLLGIWASAGCYLASREIIVIMYSDKWIGSIMCFQILSVTICTQMVNSSAGAIFQAINNTKLLFYNGLLNSCITVTAIIGGLLIGGDIESLARCVAIAYYFHFFSAFYMLLKWGFHYKIRQFIFDIYKEIVVAILVIVAVVFYPWYIENNVISFVVKGVYVTSALLVGSFATGEWKDIACLFLKRKKQTNCD